MFKKWKEEWLNRNEAKLAQAFEQDLLELKESLNSTILEWKEKKKSEEIRIAEEESKLKIHQIELDELTLRMDSKRLELMKINEDLNRQIRELEAKCSPSEVWAQAFTAGFSKAWDMIYLMNDGILEVKKMIKDQAIQETLMRVSGGNNKKNN